MADYEKLKAASHMLDLKVKAIEASANRFPLYLEKNNTTYKPTSKFEMYVILKKGFSNIGYLTLISTHDGSDESENTTDCSQYLNLMEEYNQILNYHLLKLRVYTSIIAQELNMPDLSMYFTESDISDESLENLKEVISAINSL